MEETTKLKEDVKIHRKEVRKWLDVDYTPEQISDMGMELAQKTGELRTKEEHKKSAMSQLKSEIDALSARTNELSLKVVSGKENKNVKCEVMVDYVTNKKSITRLDTMKVIFYEDIPDDEKQMEMDLENDENTSGAEQSSGAEPNQIPSDVSETKEFMSGKHEVDLETAKTEDSQEKTDEVMPGEHEVDPKLVKTKKQQAELDAEDEKIKEDVAADLDLRTGQKKVPEKESPLIYESAVGPKAQK